MRLTANIQSHKFFIILSFLYLAACSSVGYGVHRHDTTLLFFSFAVLFLLFYIIYAHAHEEETPSWLLVAILIRCSLLFATPQLSDDFYRFIWDGRLLYNGLHPFSEIPSYYMQVGNEVPSLSPELFHALNSPEYFTVYPPITQFIFWLSVIFSPTSIFGSMVVLKVFVVMAEIGSILLIRNLLLHFKLPARNSLLYALNPLVILELSGNLHFEAFVIFFLLASAYLLVTKRLLLSALLFTLAVQVKLLPLIFLPSLLPFLGLKKSVTFYWIVGIVSLALFIPFVSTSFVTGMNESLSYYFKKFEFNASLYYLIREWGFWEYGYNVIQSAGWKLALASTLLIFLFSLRRIFKKSTLGVQQLFTEWIVVLTIYLLFATTVHPWYVVPLLTFSVFSPVRYPTIWSGLIVATYMGYTPTGYQENLWIVLCEYGVVVVFLYIDFRKKNLVLT
jgi:alpha-1,6-mannosyltransferase